MLDGKLGKIPADFYIREDIFQKEIDKIFRQSWLCVGFTHDLIKNNDYLTFNTGKHQIVVQNFHGELRAFKNVCTHRFSRIQRDRKGNRPLQCPYHGWTYNKEGVPVGIPLNTKSFGFGDCEKQKLALSRYKLETVGHFVFVYMDPETEQSLKEYLGSFYEDLEHVSDICPDHFEQQQFEWAANWKVGMDNSAEAYHVPLVHPNTFGLILPLDLDISIDREHSRYTGGLKETSLRWWRNVEKAITLQPSKIYPEYANFLIFPNIVVTYSFGSFLTFQMFEPLSLSSLRLHTSAWLAKSNGRAARDLTVQSLRDFSKLVRDEDKDICELVQHGVQDSETTRPMVLGELEGRIENFQNAYMQRMKVKEI